MKYENTSVARCEFLIIKKPSVEFKPKMRNYLLTRFESIVIPFLLLPAINLILPGHSATLWDISTAFAGAAIVHLIGIGYDVYTDFKRLVVIITNDTVSGPYIFGVTTTFRLATLDRPKTLKRSMVNRLFGDIYIRSTDGGKWIHLNQFEFGKDQVEMIHKKPNYLERVLA